MGYSSCHSQITEKYKMVFVNLLTKNHITSKISPSILCLFDSLRRLLYELQPGLLLSTPQVSFRNQWKENGKHQSWAWPEQGDPKHVYRITHSLSRLYPGWMFFSVRECGGWCHVNVAGLRNAQTAGDMHFVGVSLMEFLKEMSTGLPGPSKDTALISARVSSNLVGPLEPKGEGRANDFFLSWMPSSPVLGHQSSALGLQILELRFLAPLVLRLLYLVWIVALAFLVL